MGYAHGLLLKTQVQEILPQFMDHVKSELDQYLKFLPQDIRGMVEQFGIDTVLDITHELTKLALSNAMRSISNYVCKLCMRSQTMYASSGHI